MALAELGDNLAAPERLSVFPRLARRHKVKSLRCWILVICPDRSLANVSSSAGQTWRESDGETDGRLILWAEAQRVSGPVASGMFCSVANELIIQYLFK